MADAVWWMADPDTQARELSDGTYAMAIVPMTPAGTIHTVFKFSNVPIKAYDNDDETYILAVEFV